MSSDLLVIASPMWNFGLPSSLKAWIDHIVRAGKTFNYAGAGVEGLAKGKKAVLVLILGFIGIEDVQTVRAQGMNIPGLSDNAILDGEKSIESLAL